jgi:RND family efflux transporter MFP subunit
MRSPGVHLNRPFLRFLAIPLFVLPHAKAQPVELATVASKKLNGTITIAGALERHRRTIETRIEGSVVDLLAQPRRSVNKNQLLVVLDSPTLTARIAGAVHAVATAEAAKTHSSAHAAGTQAHADAVAAAAPPGDPATAAHNAAVVSAAQTGVAAADTAERSARSDLNALRTQERDLRVRAPFSGFVTRVYVQPGDPVTRDSALLEMEETSRMRLNLDVPKAKRVWRGGRIRITLPALPGRTYSGTVLSFEDRVPGAARVEIDINNSRGLLTPGMNAEVSWPAGKRNALLVPNSAVVTSGSRTFVVRVRQGIAESVDVQTGARLKDQVEVTGLLQEGDRIVRAAADRIRDGQRIP